VDRYSDVKGLPVIGADNGRRLGIVKDIIFCPDSGEVRAFLLEREGWRTKKRVVLLRDVLNIGRDAVVVGNSACVTEQKKAEDEGKLGQKGNIMGLRVYSKAGEDLGIIEDILFDGSSGHIEGVEISDGLLQDLIKGRRVLPLFGKVEFGSENILVDREAVDEIGNSSGGLSKYLK